MSKNVRLGDFLGTELEEDFMSFDLTEIQEVLSQLKEVDAIDLSHAELLQQKALMGCDIITEYLGKIVKTVGYLETKVNSVKNKVSLEYKAPDGSRTTSEMKNWASSISPEVEDVQIRLAKAKASKMVLEKKFDILMKTHYFYKEVAMGLRRTVLGYTQNVPQPSETYPQGYE